MHRLIRAALVVPQDMIHSQREAEVSSQLDARCRSHHLDVCEAASDSRLQLERFISTVFSVQHGAAVTSFMPTLLGLRGDDHRVCGVVGLRCAAQELLFLEHYFDEPIEQVLARKIGRDIERAQIVEAGNLAGTSCRAACRLVFALPQLLLDRGHPWIVFTATGEIRRLLLAYRAPTVELGCARIERVGTLGADWGRYYERDPRVMAAHLPEALGLRRGRG